MHTNRKIITTLLICLLMLNFCLGQSGNKIPKLAQLQSWVSMSSTEFDAQVQRLGFTYMPSKEEREKNQRNFNKSSYYYNRTVSDDNQDRITFRIWKDGNEIYMNLFQDALPIYQSALGAYNYVPKVCKQSELSYVDGVCNAYENEGYRLVLLEPGGSNTAKAKEQNYNCAIRMFKKVQENNAYEIEVDMGNVSEHTIMLGYYFMGKTYIKDTTAVINGKALFKGSENLRPGLYFIYTENGSSSAQFVVDDKNQKFQLGLAMDADQKSFVISSVTNSKESKLLHDLTSFISDKRRQYNKLASSDTPGQEKITQEVRNYQEQLVKNEPNSFAALITKADLEINIPASINNITDKEKREMQQYLYYKQHFFDRVNLSDDRLLGTNIYTTKIDYYVNKLTVQHPDSIIIAIDYLVGLAAKNKETYKNCVAHLLNLYANSKYVCIDKCYVHIIDKYYNNTNAPYGGSFWTNNEEKSKLFAAAEKLRPITCGTVAPNILLASITDQENKFSLKTIKARYSILFFWQPDRCSECETAILKLKHVYEGFRSKGIEIVGIGIRWKDFNENPQSFKNYLESNKMPWLTVMDAGNRSEDLVKKFNFNTVPHFYILDENKSILLKNISLESVIEYFKDK